MEEDTSIEEMKEDNPKEDMEEEKIIERDLSKYN
jgi:hypothetical protein